MMYRHLVRAVQLLAVAALAACAADPASISAPLMPAAPSAAEMGALMATTPLNRVVELRQDRAVSRIIGINGGIISFAEVGLTVVVPPGAVTRNTRFVVTALKGKAVAYEFQPHGTTFRRPLTAVQSLIETQLPLGGAILQAGYFPNRSLVDPMGASALVSEFIPGAVDVHLTAFRWNIDHFSGYIVAW